VENNRFGSGGTRERGRRRAGLTIPVSHSVGPSAVDQPRWGGRATARSSLKVATSRASGVGATVHGTGVIEEADGADWASGGARGGNMAEPPAVLALRVSIGRVCTLNCP